QNVYQHLSSGVFFDRQTFGADRLVAPAPGGRRGAGGSAEEWQVFLDKTPLSPEARQDIHRLETAATDLFPGLTAEQKKDKLSRISYQDFLLRVVKVHNDVIPY